MNIRSRLSALTFATLLPIAIFGAVGSYMLVQRERDSFERGALDRVRALMTAIDAEFRASITPLETLAHSPALDRDDLAAFRAEAERALQARRGDWSNVLVSNAETADRLIDLLVPPGAPLPKSRDPASVLGSAKSGKPTISTVVDGPILDRPVFAVRVPVMRDGKAKYVLSGVIETSVIDGLVERQMFPRQLGGRGCGWQLQLRRAPAASRNRHWSAQRVAEEGVGQRAAGISAWTIAGRK